MFEVGLRIVIHVQSSDSGSVAQGIGIAFECTELAQQC